MTTHTPHSTQRGRCSRALFILSLSVVTGVAFLSAPAALPGSASASRAYSYGWPVKPFDRPHPIRGSFGDPRTNFHAPPTTKGLLAGAGTFGFHQGVDIAAPNGSRVYPVVSGVVERVKHEWIRVDAGDGRKFEYWHIRPVVSEGQTVQALRTLLGRIRRPAAHVHLTEYRDGQVVNPLAPGHLGPYRDVTRPIVSSIRLRRTEAGPELMPALVRGRVVFLAEAYDTPSLRVSGAWRDLPVAPALVSWRIRPWRGKAVVRDGVAFDVRNSVPENRDFWRTYARGTYQNMAVFGSHYSFLQQGCYLFKLGSTAFDTRELRDGVYDLVVTATDIQGNSSSLTRRFTIQNGPGWTGS